MTLTVTDSNGCIHDTTITVIVRPNPTANFYANTICEGDTTFFRDTSTIVLPLGGVITSWNWSMTDPGEGTYINGTSDTSRHPDFIYHDDGTYNVTLTVTDSNGCTDDTTILITVDPGPIANFSATTECEGDSTLFSDGSTIDSLGGIILSLIHI